MRGLASEALKNRIDDLETQAQVCIHILVRNLFEHTADIGFLATDGSLADYLHLPDPEGRPAVEGRLRAYADKYTVYGNIFLFDTEGCLQACLRSVVPVAPAPVARDDDAFLQSVLQGPAPYVEHHGIHGFSGDGGQTLMYAHHVEFGDRPVGVLCLECRLFDEMQAIFAWVREGSAPGEGSDAVLALVDGAGRVLGSSDSLLLPAGWHLTQAGAAGVQKVCHAGRRCLVAVRDTQGFQGYQGSGWRVVVLLPPDLAFDQGLQADGATAPAELSAKADLLSEGLCEIPRRSAVIQSALERSVWNGLLELHQLGEDADVAPHRRLPVHRRTCTAWPCGLCRASSRAPSRPVRRDAPTPRRCCPRSTGSTPSTPAWCCSTVEAVWWRCRGPTKPSTSAPCWTRTGSNAACGWPMGSSTP